ncbi:MAG: hypothetical protein DMD33_17905 [Gemmatimonadetes bacterium]|nr:MAG: hypothetical protein DMD33_17905 [Gemmatimonadota bacterium]
MTPPDIYKQFERLSTKRDAMRLRIKHLQEEVALLDAEVDLVRKEMSKHGLLRDLPVEENSSA